MRKYFLFFILLILGFSQNSLLGQPESYYCDLLAKELNGIREYPVENGRVDILTDQYAIEVEWAYNWKQSIGQALWYGLQTNRKPGIILLMKDINDRKHGIRLQSAIDYAGLTNQIKVWFYPEDFGGIFEDMYKRSGKLNDGKQTNLGNYTVNKNSKVRHNSLCAHFNCKNCVPSGPDDGGKACGKCGG
jgi:hypothetical protein